MKYEMRDENLAGIILLISGEPGEKHPNLAVAISEEPVPSLRQIWEQGKQVEMLMRVATEADTIKLWEHMLTMPGELGDRVRARRENGFAEDDAG
jgi:hypothetical protein